MYHFVIKALARSHVTQTRTTIFQVGDAKTTVIDIHIINMLHENTPDVGIQLGSPSNTTIGSLYMIPYTTAASSPLLQLRVLMSWTNRLHNMHLGQIKGPHASPWGFAQVVSGDQLSTSLENRDQQPPVGCAWTSQRGIILHLRALHITLHQSKWPPRPNKRTRRPVTVT